MIWGIVMMVMVVGMMMCVRVSVRMAGGSRSRGRRSGSSVT
jgi:hypothetical protein